MTDNVIALAGAVITSERRREFMQAIAQSFDVYVAEYGHEPDALVYVLCGAHQPSRIAWHIEGASQGAVSSVLSLAAVHCLTEAGTARQGLGDDDT